MTGRPPFKATPAKRKDVRLMKADGWSDERIAIRMEISRTTLLKHFPVELALGADMERLETLRDLKACAKKGNASAIKLLLSLTSGEAVESAGGEASQKLRVRPKGKKEQADADAATAVEGTSFGDYLRH